MRIIKKYPNRRLYDATIGAYITLDDIRELVFEHIPFQVIDARTGKDLTQNTLLQIIMEQETTTTPLFSTEMLQHFIRFYQQKSQHAFSKYLEQMMGFFTEQTPFTPPPPWQPFMDMMMGKTPQKSTKKPSKKKTKK